MNNVTIYGGDDVLRVRSYQQHLFITIAQTSLTEAISLYFNISYFSIRVIPQMRWLDPFKKSIKANVSAQGPHIQPVLCFKCP